MRGVVINLMRTADFYSADQAIQLYQVTNNLQFDEWEYGARAKNFNLRAPWLDSTFSQILNTPVVIPEDTGYFHRINGGIHFDSFEHINQWKFVVALERTMFNTYHHKSGAESALDGYQFNYKNLFDWDYVDHVLLEPGQALLYRPWTFHSFESGTTVQMFDINEKPTSKHRIILVMGLPGAGKTTLAEQISKKLRVAHINADTVRRMFNDWDFSVEGRERQAHRMKRLAIMAESDAVVDFVCPTQITRDYFNADFTIWMDTITESRFADTNSVFVPPQTYDIRITNWMYDVDSIVANINSSIV